MLVCYVPECKEKPKGVIEHPPFEPMVQSLKTTRQFVGVIVIKKSFLYAFPGLSFPSIFSTIL